MMYMYKIIIYLFIYQGDVYVLTRAWVHKYIYIHANTKVYASEINIQGCRTFFSLSLSVNWLKGDNHGSRHGTTDYGMS